MAGGGFLAGFTSGLGQSARDMNQNYMDMQLKRYSSAAKIWESMANDPNIHPSIRQQYTQNALALGNVNLFDKNSRAAADQILKQNPQDAVQKAHDAMSMTGQQMPDYYDKNTGHVNTLAFEKQKEKDRYSAQMEAQLDLLKAKQGMFGNQASTGPGTDYDKYKNQLEGQKVVFGSAVPSAAEHVIPYLEYTTKAGQKGTGPATFLNGKWFSPQGEEVSATGQLPPQIMPSQAPNGSMTYVGIPKQAGPTGIAAPPRILGNTVSEQTDPLNLSRTSHTVRQLTPIQGSSQGNVPGPQTAPNGGTLGGQGAVPPPQQPIMPPAGSNAALGASPSTPPVSSPSDIYKPAPAEQKAAFGQAEQQGLQDSFTALGLIHDIAELHKQYPVVGKFFGRYVDLANKLGWAGMISTGAQMIGLPGVQQGKDAAISDNLSKLINDDSLAQKFGMSPAEKNEWATASGRMITLIRNLGALDVKMTAGGGRGITQLYNMMRPALIDIKQDSPLIIGHSLGIADVAGERIANTLRSRYGSDVGKHLDPRQKALLQEFQQYGNVAGDYSKPIAPPANTGSQTTYKFYAKNSTSGHRIGSNDKNTWYDLTTGKPVQ